MEQIKEPTEQQEPIEQEERIGYRKPYKCMKCGKRFDEPMPTNMSYLAPDSDHIPVLVEVCPYCYSQDIMVDAIINPFILAMMAGIDVYKLVGDVIDDLVAKGELVLDDE